MRPYLPAVVLLFALAIPAGADHCTTWRTSEPELDSGANDPAPRFYLDNDLCGKCLFSIWVYQESNGIDGLQRGDEYADDTCHGLIRSDTIVF